MLNIKSWLSEFLFIRGHFSGVTGKSLYSYQVEFEEFSILEKELITNLHDAFHVVKGKYWAAMYCLYISERFRRYYGENSGEWSWDWADEKLNCNLNHHQHARLVELGLEYWQRPVRQSSNGRNFLGSLFLEGGLPWPLIKSETHGFGRVVRHGLKLFHRHQSVLGNTSDLVAETERYLPHTFQNLDTRQLLAGVIEQLMYIADKHPGLKLEVDPVAYLDKAEVNWRREFPIPISEANARNIINNWLRDASHHQAEKKVASSGQSYFTCEQVLLGDIRANWSIQTELQLPENYAFLIDSEQLTSTRLEVVFYEGEKLAARGGIVYGQIVGNKLEVRFPRQHVRLKRSDATEPVSMVLLDNGSPVVQQLFDHSALDLSDAPLVFESGSEEKRLLCNASCHTENSEVLVRVPVGSRIGGDASVDVQHREEGGGQWLLVTEHLDIMLGDDLFRVCPNSSQTSNPLRACS